MKGRKYKPTKKKLLEGNNGKRPLNTKEPEFAAETELTPPSWLNAVAKDEWNRLAPQLAAQNMFSVVDRGQLAAYCLCFSRWLHAERLVQAQIDSVEAAAKQPGKMLELPLAMEFKTHQGYAQQIPQIGTANSYLDKMRALASEFGFTPAARVRLQVEPAHKKNKDDEFFDHPEQGGRIPDAALH